MMSRSFFFVDAFMSPCSAYYFAEFRLRNSRPSQRIEKEDEEEAMAALFVAMMVTLLLLMLFAVKAAARGAAASARSQ